jgi:hypothetical protein
LGEKKEKKKRKKKEVYREKLRKVQRTIENSIRTYCTNIWNPNQENQTFGIVLPSIKNCPNSYLSECQFHIRCFCHFTTRKKSNTKNAAKTSNET